MGFEVSFWSRGPRHRPFVHHPAGDVVAGGRTRAEVCRGVVLLNVELVQRQSVHEGLHQVVCGEVEDQAEEDGDGQSGERLLEDGEEEQGQTQALRGGADKQSCYTTKVLELCEVICRT